MEGPAWVADEPGADLGMLVGGVVVDDGMDELAGRHLRLDGVEEADELLVTVALHVATDHRAVDEVEGSKQGGGAVALVVMRHGAGAPFLHGQPGLGTVEGLDLALLVDGEHDGVSRRVDIEADDVPELVGELGILRQLESADVVGSELVGFQDALHRAQADAGGRGQHAARPVGRLARWRPEDKVDDALDRVGRQRRLAGRPGLVAQQPVDALGHEAGLPTPDHGLGPARPAHDLESAAALGRGQDDLRPPDVLLRCVAIRDDRLQPTAILGSDCDDDACSHPNSLDRFLRFGNRPNESDH